MDWWIWAQLAYVPLFLAALVAYARQEQMHPLPVAAIAVGFLALSAGLNFGLLA